MEMKVLFLTNIPVPYRIDFFNEFGKFVDLTVVFDRRNADDREDSWLKEQCINFKGYFLDSYKVGMDNGISLRIFTWLNKRWDYIIVGTHTSYNSLLAMMYMKLRGIKYILNCDGGIFYKNESSVKKLLKKFFVSSSEYYLSTGKHTNNWLKCYGGKKNRIYNYQLASFYSDYISEELDVIKKDKLFIKRELSVYEQQIILSVGRFIQEKGFDVLIEAAKFFDKKNVGIYIIGGDFPLEYWYEIIETNDIKNLHFIPFQCTKNLKKWFVIADIFVLPTRNDSWGLVVNEAMAHGLPVITTDRCNAGLELIENYKNGFIVPVDDNNKLSEKINLLLENEMLRKQQGLNNLKKIKNYTIEKMAERHFEILNIIQNR